MKSAAQPARRRILVLSNLYPPLVQGGYEVECAAVVEHLRRRHEVLVLTSAKGRRRSPAEPGVSRTLPFLPRRRIVALASPLYSLRAATVARRALRAFEPDLVYVWNGAQLPQATVRVLETSGAVVAYRVCEHWFGALYRSRYDPFMRGLAGGRWRRAMRALNRLPGLRVEAEHPVDVSVSWNSETLRRQVEAPPLVNPVLERVAIPATRQSEAFVGLERRPSEQPTVGYVGRVSPEKGIDVAIRAIAELRRGADLEVGLRIAGSGPASHRRELLRLAERLGVAGQVAFLGQCDVAALKELFRSLHALVVPSVWEEPAGLVLVEGALAGVPLIASRVGGIPEIVRDPEEALLCPPGDVVALAEALRRTLTEPEATAARARNAAERAQAFRIDRYLAAMDGFLRDALAVPPRGPAAS